jgi:hypothetical protein
LVRIIPEACAFKGYTFREIKKKERDSNRNAAPREHHLTAVWKSISYIRLNQALGSNRFQAGRLCVNREESRADLQVGNSLYQLICGA